MDITLDVKQTSLRIQDTTSTFLSGKDFTNFNMAFTKQTGIKDYRICGVYFCSESSFNIILMYQDNNGSYLDLWQTDMNSPDVVHRLEHINRR